MQQNPLNGFLVPVSVIAGETASRSAPQCDGRRFMQPMFTQPITRFRQAGMTLTELLIAVTIVGILATVAYPSYQNYIRQGSRAEAKGVLLETAQFMERNYTTNGCYHRNDNSCASAANLTLPFPQAPKTGTATYNITATYSTTAPCTLGQCFTLSAAPTGKMTGDECGTLTLSHTGARGQDAGATQEQCWQR